ncbi:MAG: hypothetical protein V5A46_00320 [Haloferacaceae archaeon]
MQTEPASTDEAPAEEELIDGEPRESYSPAETHPEPDRVRIGGRDAYDLDRDTARRRFDWRETEFTARCHSGTLIEGTWAGVPLGEALEAADPPPETTHVALIGIDRYSRCVPILDVLDGIVGFECVDERDDGAPRVVSPDLDSQASVMRLGAIEPIALSPGVEPEEVDVELPTELEPHPAAIEPVPASDE